MSFLNEMFQNYRTFLKIVADTDDVLAKQKAWS